MISSFLKLEFMEIRNLSLILCGLIATFQLSAQETELVKPLKISSFTIGFGGFNQHMPHFTISEFKTLAPELELLNIDISDFSIVPVNQADGGSITALMELSIGNKNRTGYRTRPFFRVGFNYLGGMGVTQKFRMSQSTPSDTIYSENPELITYVDSIRHQRYERKYRSNHLQLDISSIYRSKSKSLLTFFVGVGVSVGFSLHTKTTIDYSDEEYSSETRRGSIFGTPHKWDIQESVRNTQNFAFQMFTPMGAALQFGKKKEFFRDLYFFTELRPGLGYYQISELKTSFTKPFFQQFFGFRYELS